MSTRSRATLTVGALALVACGTAAGEPFAAVVADTTELTPTRQSFVFDHPLTATDDENGVCFHFGPQATLLENWSVAPMPDMPGVYPRAEAVLTDGRRVPLTNKVWSEAYCLQPERQGPLSAPVRELQLWSSAPTRVNQISWYSTHK